MFDRTRLLGLLAQEKERFGTEHPRSRALFEQAQQSLPIRIVELPYRLPKMKQLVQWHKYRSQDAGLSWLRGLIREVA